MKKLILIASILALFSCGSSSSDNKKDGKDVDCDAALLEGEEAAIIPAEIAGTYTLTYTKFIDGADFEHGETVEMEVTEEGKLTIGDYTLYCPVYGVVEREGGVFEMNEAEAVWKDAENDVSYSLKSLTAGNFHQFSVRNNVSADDPDLKIYGMFNEFVTE